MATIESKLALSLLFKMFEEGSDVYSVRIPDNSEKYAGFNLNDLMKFVSIEEEVELLKISETLSEALSTVKESLTKLRG